MSFKRAPTDYRGGHLVEPVQFTEAHVADFEAALGRETFDQIRDELAELAGMLRSVPDAPTPGAIRTALAGARRAIERGDAPKLDPASIEALTWELLRSRTHDETTRRAIRGDLEAATARRTDVLHAIEAASARLPRSGRPRAPMARVLVLKLALELLERAGVEIAVNAGPTGAPAPTAAVHVAYTLLEAAGQTVSLKQVEGLLLRARAARLTVEHVG